MNNFVRLSRIDLYPGSLTHYYTVTRQGKKSSQFERFIQLYGNDKSVETEFKEIVYWLKKLSGQAVYERHFRNERLAVALPPSFQIPGYPRNSHLRLYGIRVSEHLVVLLGGGIKTPGTKAAQKCPIVAPHFHLAQKVSSALRAALEAKLINLTSDKRDFDKPDFLLELI